jgi:tetratricopeptide (TPR) repeat protein
MNIFWRIAVILPLLVNCGPDEGTRRDEFARAQMELNGGNRKVALEKFESIEACWPGETEAGVIAGRLRFFERDWAGAEAAFTRVLEKNPARHEALLWRAKARRAAGDRDTALADLEQLLELDGDNTEAWINKGRILEEKGDIPGAVAAYQMALSTEEFMGFAHERLGAIYSFSGLPGQAATHREKAAALKKSQEKVHE